VLPLLLPPLSLCQKVSLADDDEGVLTQWRTSEQGTLEVVADAEKGRFKTSEMYIVLYSCKRGSLNVVYTWEGSSASLAARTATVR